jgi:hypothetical protein
LPILNRRFNTVEVTAAVCRVLIDARCELVLIDEIHNLSLATYLEAAHYPDIVTFATWLISPRWRTVLIEAPLSERLEFFELLHRLGLIRTGIPAAEAAMVHWLESQKGTGKPPVPFWLLTELKYWPPGRTEWLRDFLRFKDDPTPDEWIQLAKSVVEQN